jgi:hypothetical protein
VLVREPSVRARRQQKGQNPICGFHAAAISTAGSGADADRASGPLARLIEGSQWPEQPEAVDPLL